MTFYLRQRIPKASEDTMFRINNPEPIIIKDESGKVRKLPDGTPAAVTLGETLKSLLTSPDLVAGKTGMEAVFLALDVRNELERIDWSAREVFLSEKSYRALDNALKKGSFNLQLAAELAVVFNAWMGAALHVVPRD